MTTIGKTLNSESLVMRQLNICPWTYAEFIMYIFTQVHPTTLTFRCTTSIKRSQAIVLWCRGAASLSWKEEGRQAWQGQGFQEYFRKSINKGCLWKPHPRKKNCCYCEKMVWFVKCLMASLAKFNSSNMNFYNGWILYSEETTLVTGGSLVQALLFKIDDDFSKFYE